jgi:hypothetical protein
MTDVRRYTHVHTDHIRIVLKTKPGEKVKWPQEVKGPDLEAHRRQIRTAAKNHLIKEGKLLYRVSFTKTKNARSIDGKYQKLYCIETKYKLTRSGLARGTT